MLVSALLGAALAAPIVVPDLPDTPIAHHGVQLKLVDAAGARLVGGTLTGSQVDEVRAVLRDHGATLRPVYGPHAQKLVDLAEARTGVAQPDLLATFEVVLPDADRYRLHALAEDLADAGSVDWVQMVAHGAPPPIDIAPPTGTWEQAVGFQNPAQGGLDVDFLRSQGISGTDVMVFDVEYGWTTTHEDFEDIAYFEEPSVFVPSWVYTYGWDAHGTATVGEVAAPENGFGMAGVLPDALIGLYPEFEVGPRRADAIASAASVAIPGDVIMLEMQADIGGGGYGPAEMERAVFDATQVAVAAGIVVVGAAGNGTQDLDNAFYQANYGVFGDSGAILVGAGTSDSAHTPMWFSSYGSRVDVQAWGENVETLGYGDLATLNFDWNQTYTAVFGGTSSATPIVTAAAAAIQEYAIERSGAPLPPSGVRQLLRDTGIPQGFGVDIGPFPDLVQALTVLDEDGDSALSTTFGGTDCDDGDAAVFPGATDVDGDGVDTDCDGSDLPRMTLAVAPAIAGQANTWTVTNAAPGSTVVVAHGNEGVSTAPCGAPLGIAAPVQLGSTVADGAGNASLTATPPANASGATRTFQVVEIGSCRASLPSAVTFQ